MLADREGVRTTMISNGMTRRESRLLIKLLEQMASSQAGFGPGTSELE